MDVHDEYSLICFCDVHDEYSLFFSWGKLEIIVYLCNFELIYINNHYVNEKRFRKGDYRTYKCEVTFFLMIQECYAVVHFNQRNLMLLITECCIW